MNTLQPYHIISLRFLQNTNWFERTQKNILLEYSEYIIKFKEKYVVIILYHYSDFISIHLLNFFAICLTIADLNVNILQNYLLTKHNFKCIINVEKAVR